MSIFLSLAYLFFIGSLLGWVLELFFRRFISSANPERKWINPGFCTGPYLPLYGSGLCILYLLASIGDNSTGNSFFSGKLFLFIMMAISMTAIEYIAGYCTLKWAKVRLWDYRNEWGNIQGIICPKFSLFWAILGALYYFCVHPYILDALRWLSANLAFSFVIGFFFGVFTIDVVHSGQLLVKLRQYANEYQVVIKYEDLKAHIRSVNDSARIRAKFIFLFPFRSEISLAEQLKSAIESREGLVNFIEKQKLKIKGKD